MRVQIIDTSTDPSRGSRAHCATNASPTAVFFSAGRSGGAAALYTEADRRDTTDIPMGALDAAPGEPETHGPAQEGCKPESDKFDYSHSNEDKWLRGALQIAK